WRRSSHELVPHPVHGQDQLGPELLAERGDVHVHSAGDRRRAVAPYLVEQLVTRENGAAVVDEIAQQLQLQTGEIDLFAVARDDGAAEVDAHRTEEQHLRIRHGMTRPT